MFWIILLESDSLFAIDDSGMVKWNEQNYTRVSVPTKTNSKMKLFHEELPLRMNKETAGSQKKKKRRSSDSETERNRWLCEVQAILWVRWPPE